ncbi:calcium/proton exchanger [Cryphonectria parasitica EP155]|uniref:Calcium/proton exchanger n=1 Tax=Cryphonectria parasitica (strain ATCC 38755 / EP155) TaxID=660469 RepID=A0A9P4XXV4_CRYP1|nr:calcium/proton exchanger [Cryphonectria parasitica EP155]KAF3762792.1 calcium/proton exchanger [Cryphonectria parasitica EP155]
MVFIPHNKVLLLLSLHICVLIQVPLPCTDRIRGWARAKAHGKNNLITSDRRSANPTARTSTGLSQAGSPRPFQKQTGSSSQNNDASVEGTGHVSPAEGEKPQREKKNVMTRFFAVIWNVLTSSWINVLLVFVPVGIAAHFANMSQGIIFAMNAIAIVPLAGLLAHATESVSKKLGDTIGALMNVTFGNAVELIIFIIALVKNEIRIVQASLLGSILSNLLLILGMCFVLGGLRFREQIYNSTVTQMSACLLSLSVISLLLPTAFHASFSSSDEADSQVLKVSRGTSVILLIVYFLYLIFQLNSHAYMYESTPQHVIDAESVPGPAAHYFDSSSSSESDSSSSDSDSSGHSFSTARRIKRAIKKGKRSRKQSVVSADAEKPINLSNPASPAAAEPSLDAVERTTSEPAASSSSDPVTSRLTQEAVEALPKSGEKKKKKRKHHEKHHHGEAQQDEEGSPSVPAGLPQGVVDGADDSNTKRVDFALAPDLEAQPTTTKPKPFSLRTLRPNLPKNFSQNVFNPVPAPQPQPVNGQQPPRPLRRTQSLPSQHHSYRGNPGSLPPIVPIVVNSQSKSQTDEDEDEEPEISRTSAILLLLGSTALVALCAEFMVDSIDGIVGGSSGISETFVGLILLPIVGNAAEHVTAVTVAMKNKMDLAIGVAIGSSIQIALFVTPLVVILGWIMNKDMSLYFTLFETISMFVSAFIVNFLVLDGRSNYLEGSLLCASYIIIALAAFFYPDSDEASSLGGGDSNATETAQVVTNLMTRGMANLIGWQ